jgi:hypothetical protein
MDPSPSAPSRRTLLLFSGLATTAAVAGIVADLALQYTPERSALLSPTYQYLAQVPEWRLLLGHFLGIGAITLQLAGFWVMYQLARAGSVRSALPVMLVTGFSVVLGVTFHGTFALVALVVQAQRAAPADAAPLLASTVGRVGAFTRPLGACALLGLAGVSLWYSWIVARGRTLLPRGLALCNPLTFFLLCAVLAALIPAAALALDPAALNISTTVTFLALTLALWRTERGQAPGHARVPSRTTADPTTTAR